MITSTLRKTLLAASLIVACGGIGMSSAFAHGQQAGTQADTSVGDKVSDAWITTKVKSEFATTSGVSATNISVETQNGMVVLSGDVGSSAEKALAEQTARGVKGVTGVSATGLRVVAATTGAGTEATQSVGNAVSNAGAKAGDAGAAVGDAAADTWITTKVKSEFATTEGVSATDISVTTKGSTVWLTGTVKTQAEADRAKQVAMGVKGVKSVDTSGLTVSGTL